MTEKRIQLTKEQREEWIQVFMQYCSEELELDEEFGHLRSELLLRFILRELGPIIYNQGVQDASRWLMQKMDDLVEIELPTRS